jgi:hypothetical protein
LELLKDILILCAVLLASIQLGKLFLAEFAKARAKGLPWYAPYLTLPGLLVLAAILLPLFLWLFRR